MENNSKIAFGSGVFLLVAIGAFLLIPNSDGKTLILTTRDESAPISCLDNDNLILAQNLTDLCDVVIVSPTTNQIIRYNGSYWVNVNSTSFDESTTCNNIGVGIIICAGDNVNLKTLLNGTGIIITNSSNTITVANTRNNIADLNDTLIISPQNGQMLVYQFGIGKWINCEDCISITDLADVEINFTTIQDNDILRYNNGDGVFEDVTLSGGSGISISHNSTHTIITNTAPDNTTCVNLGASSSLSEGIFVSGECNFKKLLEGSNISLSSNSTHITIAVTGITSENTDCTSAGGTTIIKTSSGGDCDFKGLTAGVGLTLTSNTNDNNYKTNFANGTGITITGTGQQTFNSYCTNTGSGEAICESSNNINSLLSGDTGTLTITDTTGDLTLTPKLSKLCVIVASGGETSLTCTWSTSNVKSYIIQSQLSMSGGTAPTIGFRFNGDTGGNYAQRSSTNGGADSTTTSATSMFSVALTNSQVYTWDLMGVEMGSGTEKYVYGDRDTAVAGAGNAPSRVELVGKWANTANSITDIELVRTAGTSTFDANSFIEIWGVVN